MIKSFYQYLFPQQFVRFIKKQSELYKIFYQSLFINKMKKKGGPSNLGGKTQEQPKIKVIKKSVSKAKVTQIKPKIQTISKQLEKTKQQELKTTPSSNIKKVEQIKVIKKEQIKPVKMPQMTSKIPPQIPKNNNLNMNKMIEKKVQTDIKLVKEVDKEKKIVAVIVSFMSGSSYDNLFTSVEQKTEDGTQVIVYSCSSSSVNQILKGFLSQSENILVRNLIENVKSVDPDCVVFNWQCCSHYSTKKFHEGSESVFQFIKLVIDRGHMVMFSDFSLKALIAQWKENIMGPNPFVAVKQHSDFFVLHFDCQKLKDCPSAQLQIVGDMATEGHCNVHALGGTIVYGINSQKADNDSYKLQVLTVASNFSKEKNYTVEINGHKGLAGHVLLTYKSGGCLLVSMGHWIELMKIDTSQKVLFEVAARQFGEEKMKSMKMEYESLNEVQKKDYIAKNSVQFVQSQAPCKNMSKKAKRNF